MHFSKIVQFVEGASDPAYAVDGNGMIVAWNRRSAEVFGLTSGQAIGNTCLDVICSKSIDGNACSRRCQAKQLAKRGHKVPGFDLHISTIDGNKWFCVTVLVVSTAKAELPFTIHVLQPIDLSMHLDALIRDFLAIEPGFSRSGLLQLDPVTSPAAIKATLTTRELEVLKLVAKSETSRTIADKLKISPTTADSHMRSVLKKLSVHSRPEAVRRAGVAGLI